MCGIAGFSGLSVNIDEAQSSVRRMCDAIAHRGPDSDGFFVSDGVALGMRRLSVIDVAGGRQPIENEDGSVVVVFNGEIYNHHALRTRLVSVGHVFRTRSDTEVLVHAFEEYGPEMVSRLEGMFAFAIWDKRTKSLFIARDRTGMKPLSYVEMDGGLAFFSELRSLAALVPRSKLRVSPASVVQYLAFGYVPDPLTIFEGVKKLRPGHTIHWTAGRGAVVRQYWKAPYPEQRLPSEAELVDTLASKLDAAVASHLESEVPLGAFLSGGLDSSTVVALMTKHAAGRVKTFSIGFTEEKYDESPAARAVAQAFGTDHTELIVRPKVETMFESIGSLFDEPFADSSAIPTFLVAQLARQSVTVALSGDGGDELFGGYTRYGETLKRNEPSGAQRLLSSAALFLPHMFPGRNRLIDLGRSRWGQYTATVVMPVRSDEGGFSAADLPGAECLVQDQLGRYFGEAAGADFAATMMRADLETYLPGDILTKVDRTSMAVSLEARVPMLDFGLVDFALSLPGHMRVTPHESKRLFRKAIRTLLPEFVFSRPKRGFELPLATWFRGPLRHRIEALRDLPARVAPFVDRGAVRRLINEHSIGRRDHSWMLWRLMVLDSWLTAFEAGALAAPPRLPPAVLDG